MMRMRHLFATMSLCLVFLSQGIASEVEEYVVGGAPVKPTDDQSWMASIRLTANQLSHNCGGTVVNQYWVLTAAHCVVQKAGSGQYQVTPPSQLSVMVGTTNSTVEDVATLYAISHVVVHPKYSPQAIVQESVQPDGSILTEVISTALDNDIALLRVNRPFAANITPVRLASDKDADDLDQQLGLQWSDKDRPENTKVSGWGSRQTSGAGISERLMEAKLSFVPMEECFNRLELGNEVHYIIDNPFNRTKVCALPPFVIFDSDGDSNEFGPDSCKGDSGGPLRAKNGEDHWVQFGIVSGGPVGKLVCGSLVRPSFYTRVGTYYSWIESKVGTIPDQPVTKPDFIVEKEVDEGGSENTGSSEDEADTEAGAGNGKEDEVDKAECNSNASGISHTNCNMNTASGGASTWYGLLSLVLLGFWKRTGSNNS